VLLTITAAVSGSDLGYLLHKNPSHAQSFELPFGKAHVFYPRQSEQEAQAALLLDIDPVGLVRGKGQGEGKIDQYVNDRPYVASSFLSVAISRVFGTAMNGKSKERQSLAEQPIGLDAVITAVPTHSGESFLRSLFQPLGYEVRVERHALDDQFPEWGEGPYYTVGLKGNVRLQDLLTHIYVLVPVLDEDKHYWVGKDEVEKLLSKGEGWLPGHPQKEAIASRYLRFNRALTREALARLVEEDVEDPDEAETARLKEELALEAPLRLWEQRIDAVVAALATQQPKSVVDLGCGEGKLLKALLEDRSIERVLGMDVSWRILEVAAQRLHLEHMAPVLRARIELIQGSLLYRDDRLRGFDAATLTEVIEHLDPSRLAALERVVFEQAEPKTVVVTTPNAEYNVRFASLPAGAMRHKDHRFEWTRSEFTKWADSICDRFGYRVRFVSVGSEDSEVGSPTQMGVFTR
jgi:3' terminal RNA ribose 2'-O-methyltransferase Hen1